MKKVYMAVCAAILSLVCLIGCGTRGTVNNPELSTSEERTSLFALIMRPEEFDGEEIIVRGALFIDGEEDVALYATTADGTYMVKLNALWLGKIADISAYTEAELRALDGQYVEVKGRVDANQRGPGDAYNCELEEVKKIQKVEPENTLPSQKPLPTMWVY